MDDSWILAGGLDIKKDMEETRNERAFFNRLKAKNQSIFVLYRIRRATTSFEFFHSPAWRDGKIRRPARPV
jgi:hypothetical protein